MLGSRNGTKHSKSSIQNVQMKSHTKLYVFLWFDVMFDFHVWFERADLIVQIYQVIWRQLSGSAVQSGRLAQVGTVEMRCWLYWARNGQ